jgi:HAMP domain/Histidine kinase-, DNA gyrase B-, and HSP90-like ATPase
MFRNLPIRSKFVTVLSVPLIGIIALATIGISRSIEVVDRSNQTEKVAAFAAGTDSLNEALDWERFVMRMHLLTKGDVPLPRVRARWAERDAALERFRDRADALAAPERTQMRIALDETFADLDQLDGVRKRLLDGSVSRNFPEQNLYLKVEGELGRIRQLATAATQDRLTGIAQDLKGASNRSVLFYALAAALVLALAVGISVPIAGSMVRSLHRLHDASLEVAERQLPGVVASLQTARSAEDIQLDTTPLEVDSKDEIGQVAEAFNAVHQVAVRTAVEQAALRKSIGDMFMNLARRSQSLLDRQIKLIDQLERAEEDPDALEDLFRLDHLATRMRRNAENLIVLSGAEPARRWGQPVGLGRVARAAVAEVEDYTRVELLPLDNVGVVGQAVGDIVHLLAELIENATSFSPPNSRVLVSGETVPDGYMIEIEDRGIGMTDAELMSANERLARPPMIDFALDRMLGFYVVGRLAQRYGIRVQLRHSWYGGITALVWLPERLIVHEGAPVLPGSTGEHPAVEQRAPQVGFGPPNLLPPAGVAPVSRTPVFEAARADWFESPNPPGPPQYDDQQVDGTPAPGQPAAQHDGDGVPSSPSEVRSMLARYRTTWTHGANQ